MSKNRRNNRNNQQKQAAQPNSTPAQGNRQNKMNQFKEFFSKVDIKTDDKTLDTLSAEQQKQFEQLTTQLKEKVTEYERLLQANEKDKQQLEAKAAKQNTQHQLKQDELQKQQDLLDGKSQDIELQRQEIKARIEDIRQQQHTLKQKQNSLLKREEVLLEQQADAKAGFVELRQQSFEKLVAQQQKLDDDIDKLAQQKQQHALDIEADKRQQQIAFNQQLQASLAQDQTALNERHQQIEQQARDLTQQQQALEEQKQQHGIEFEQLKADESYQRELLQATIDQLEQSRERDLSEFKALQAKLAGFKELEREMKKLDLQEPHQVLTQLDETKQALSEAKTQLQGRDVSEIEQELEDNIEELEQLRAQNQDYHQQLTQAKSKEHKFKLGVREKEELHTQNVTLEAHNAALKQSVNLLKTDLEDLIEKQQHKNAFKALTAMDKNFAEPTTVSGIKSLSDFVTNLQHGLAQVDGKNLYYDIDDIRKFVAGLAMGQLHIFQGISGTGKTSLVKAFAKVVGGHVTTVPVQAGWRDKDDLIGHYNAFEKRYYEKECLQAIYRAHTPKFENRFNIILLDEMNLSRPEQYFAEFLSAIEMSEQEREIVLMEAAIANAPKAFVEDRKLLLKSNTWFMGTANHDETTFEFADKTHDRAFVMDLERHLPDEDWKAKKLEFGIVGVDSVLNLFAKAKKEHKNDVSNLINKLNNHKFSTVLQDEFEIGWGHRFESQAYDFISAYIACGGQGDVALEHLLITRLLRKGKVLGRFDITKDKLNELQKQLTELFKDSKNSGEKASLILEREIERKEQGAY